MADEETTEPVLVTERRGAVTILRLNRPEARNSLNPALLDAIGLEHGGGGERPRHPGDRLDRHRRQGVLRRHGPARLRRGRHGRVPARRAWPGSAVSAAARSRCPSWARRTPPRWPAVSSCCSGVTSWWPPEAASFGVPEVKRGLFAAGGGVFISTRIPLAAALELTLTGDLIDAVRAQSLGLINQVVPQAEVLDAAVALAERIARNGPLALPATKQMVRTASTDLERAQELARGVAAEGLRLARTPRKGPRRSSRSATPCGRAAEPARCRPRRRRRRRPRQRRLERHRMTRATTMSLAAAQGRPRGPGRSGCAGTGSGACRAGSPGSARRSGRRDGPAARRR